MFKVSFSLLALSAAALSVVSCAVSTPPQAVTVKLRVLETSDLHANVMDYNYYTATQDPSIGLARTASLVNAARREAVNTVLVDNGDLIQGSPMGDYAAHKGLADGEVRELIIATNPTVEGEATAHYLAQLAHQAGVSPSRLAHGVPLGGELELVDGGTLAHSFAGRKPISL